MTNKLKGKCILVVEDDLYSSKFFSEVLKPYEVVLLFCETAEESIAFVKKNKQIDLVLMDIRLPKEDGLFAAKEIKSIRKDLPIIAQTAYALEGDKQKALDGGCDAYLSKPIVISQLIDTLNMFFS